MQALGRVLIFQHLFSCVPVCSRTQPTNRAIQAALNDFCRNTRFVCPLSACQEIQADFSCTFQVNGPLPYLLALELPSDDIEGQLRYDAFDMDTYLTFPPPEVIDVDGDRDQSNYTLGAIIANKRGNHFIAYVRDPSSGNWFKYDDQPHLDTDRQYADASGQDRPATKMELLGAFPSSFPKNEKLDSLIYVLKIEAAPLSSPDNRVFASLPSPAHGSPVDSAAQPVPPIVPPPILKPACVITTPSVLVEGGSRKRKAVAGEELQTPLPSMSVVFAHASPGGKSDKPVTALKALAPLPDSGLNFVRFFSSQPRPSANQKRPKNSQAVDLTLDEQPSDANPVRPMTRRARPVFRSIIESDDDLPNVLAVGGQLATIDETSHDAEDDALLAKPLIRARTSSADSAQSRGTRNYEDVINQIRLDLPTLRTTP